ncbi:unnamed protein product [Dibothriocephalus latus]|uniref:Uncharacterized protein n=1 Tax=Dibothriocephalus latus TaxID=60516 RepID=A0A3P7MEB9_DIBLA|nr:unnamed protein product [Dibothriocephalus latus]
MAGTSPRVTIGGSGSKKIHPVSSPATETEDKKSKHSFHVLKNGVEPRVQLPFLFDAFRWAAVPDRGQHSKARGTDDGERVQTTSSPLLNGLRKAQHLHLQRRTDRMDAQYTPIVMAMEILRRIHRRFRRIEPPQRTAWMRKTMSSLLCSFGSSLASIYLKLSTSAS